MTKSRYFVIMGIIAVLATIGIADTNWNLQATDAAGEGTHSELGEDSEKVTVEGIILNRPEDMVGTDPSNNGQWQIYIQGIDGDHAGSAVYMRKNNFINGLYSDTEWGAELYRITHDPTTGRQFQPGDKVSVTGYLKFYHGKTNINERHTIDPDYDFDINLVTAAAGLPQPEVITLDEVKDANDNFIFHNDRTYGGCEYYQGTLVRVNSVEIISGTWAENGVVTVEDESGKTFPVKLGLGSGFSQYSEPAGLIDVIGIFDQEDASSPYSGYYRIWVTDYDGNGFVLADDEIKKGCPAGDVNIDGIVNMKDFAIMAANWLQ